MKPYTRQTPGFSLCGLNCCLCPRSRTEGTSRCPGCGGADFDQKHTSCAIISCSLRHDGVAYCFQCGEYPCDRYTRNNDKDSFITYLHVPHDMDEAVRTGLDSYLKRLSRKSAILDILLEKWDNGRLKSFFCLAVNLLPLENLEAVMTELEQNKNHFAANPDGNPADYGNLAKEVIGRHAAERGIELKLRK